MTMNSDFTVLPVNILQNVGPNENYTRLQFLPYKAKQTH